MQTTTQTFKKVFTASIVSATLLCSGFVSAHQDAHHQNQLEKAIAGDHRSEKNKSRDEYRHPKQTLEFFGFNPMMTVVEITPGGGWYTEILAPAVKGKGKLYGAHYPDTGEDNYYSNSRKQLVKKLASNDIFSEVELTNFVPRQESELAPAGTADYGADFS